VGIYEHCAEIQTWRQFPETDDKKIIRLILVSSVIKNIEKFLSRQIEQPYPPAVSLTYALLLSGVGHTILWCLFSKLPYCWNFPIFLPFL